MEKQDTRNLKKRYLIWFYKTTKEAFDRIERKFTQSEVDRFILKELENTSFDNKNIDKYIQEFEDYIENKEKDGVSLKYEKGKLKPEYAFLEAKLKAVENAIVKELGKSGLKEIKSLYEKEMTERVLRSTEH